MLYQELRLTDNGTQSRMMEQCLDGIHARLTPDEIKEVLKPYHTTKASILKMAAFERITGNPTFPVSIKYSFDTDSGSSVYKIITMSLYEDRHQLPIEFARIFIGGPNPRVHPKAITAWVRQLGGGTQSFNMKTEDPNPITRFLRDHREESTVQVKFE